MPHGCPITRGFSQSCAWMLGQIVVVSVPAVHSSALKGVCFQSSQLRSSKVWYSSILRQYPTRTIYLMRLSPLKKLEASPGPTLVLLQRMTRHQCYKVTKNSVRHYSSITLIAIEGYHMSKRFGQFAHKLDPTGDRLLVVNLRNSSECYLVSYKSPEQDCILYAVSAGNYSLINVHD